MDGVPGRVDGAPEQVGTGLWRVDRARGEQFGAEGEEAGLEGSGRGPSTRGMRAPAMTPPVDILSHFISRFSLKIIMH